MKKVIAYIILGVVVIGLLALNIWFSTYCYSLNYNMWLNEFNAQMSTFGFYKEDVHMLNQVNTEIKFIWCLIVNVTNYLIIAVGAVVVVFKIDDYLW